MDDDKINDELQRALDNLVKLGIVEQIEEDGVVKYKLSQKGNQTAKSLTNKKN